MSQHLKMCLSAIILSCSLTSCGVLWPEMADRPPIVLTKVETKMTPVLLDPTCPQPPPPPAKRTDGRNTLSEDAAEYLNQYRSWAVACADLNAAIESILRPSKEELKPAVN